MRRVIACLLMPSYLAGCSMWEVQTQTTPQHVVAQEQHLDVLHVTLSDGSWVVLEQPEVSGDSLIGVVTQGEYRGQPLEQGLLTGIELAEVSQVAVQKKSLRATAMPWLAAAAVVGTAVLVVVYAQLKNSEPWPPLPFPSPY